MTLWPLLFLSVICSGIVQQVAVCIPLDKRHIQIIERQGVIKKVTTDKPWIALTFDDGPDPNETPLILDVLKKYNAKATFFVIGEQGRHNPDILRQEVSEGHELANHTFSHRNFRGLSAKEIRQEILKWDDEIYAITGRHSKLFRPPGGYYNDTIVQTAEQMGYRLILWTWNQDSRDWSKPGVHIIVRKVISNAHSGDIVLFHDRISGRSQTAKALSEIIPELQKRGYRFVTVSQLMESTRHDE